MFHRLSVDDFKMLIQGVSVTFEEGCEITFHEPKKDKRVVFLQPIIGGVGPTKEQVEVYADLVRQALDQRGMGDRASMEVTNMPIPGRMGCERDDKFVPHLVRVQLI